MADGLFGGKFEFRPDRIAGPSDGPDVAGGRKGRAARDAVPVTGNGEIPKPAREGVGVGQLLRMVRGALNTALPRTITVLGEISNLSQPSSGHVYFSLKDAEAQIPAAMFRSAAVKMKFRPADGMEVLATGRVDVYEAQGKLQLYVTRLEPRGIGSLELAFRQLREKLAAEGLFDPAGKRAIPAFPQRICVITSPTGAAIRDISRTLRRRWPAAEVLLIPVAVQGDQAAAQIARAVRQADAAAETLGIDTLIVGRGGGSLEDLWCFNEEIVARAVADCRIPVISGVGHEVDTTICDLAADLRAATPTAAAEQAVPDRGEYLARCADSAARMRWSVTRGLETCRSHLRAAMRAELFASPMAPIQRGQQRLDELASAMRAALIQAGGDGQRVTDRLTERLRWSLGHLAKLRADRLAAASIALASKSPAAAIAAERRQLLGRQRQARAALRALLKGERAKLRHAEAMLEAMSYRKVLRRGFSVTRDADGRIVAEAAAAEAAGLLETEFIDGRIRSTVIATATPATPTTPTPAAPPDAAPRRKARTTKTNNDDPAPGLFDDLQ